MSDYASGLPVRSEADGADERLQTKIVDATSPDTQQMEVDADSNAHVEVHGNRADDAADVALLLSEEGRPNGRGDYDADDNSKPNTSGLIAHARSATHDDTELSKRPTAVDGASDSVCLDTALHDESGQPYSASNPLPVTLEESEGDEVVSYASSTAVAAAASVNHNYTVTALKTLVGSMAWISASAKLKVEVKLETAAASGVFNNKFVGFNSTANPNIEIPLHKILKQVAGAIVRITITNLDNQPQDVYSTLVGVER